MYVGFGIFGGTFDPIHYGHLRSAWEVAENLDFPVSMVPAGNPPHRPAPLASGAHRVAMLHLALADQDRLCVDERELQRPGPSYMVDTLASFRETKPRHALCLILGGDAFAGLHRWHRWQEIAQLAHIVVITRAGRMPDLDSELRAWSDHRWLPDRRGLRQTRSGSLLRVSVSPLAISASDVRQRIAHGMSPRYLLPGPVWGYIQQFGLYSCPSEKCKT